MTKRLKNKDWWHNLLIHAIPLLIDAFRSSFRAAVFIFHLLGGGIIIIGRTVLHIVVPIYVGSWRIRRLIMDRIPMWGGSTERTPIILMGAFMFVASGVTIFNLTFERHVRPDVIGANAIIASFTTNDEDSKIEHEFITPQPAPVDARPSLIRLALEAPSTVTRSMPDADNTMTSVSGVESGALIAPTITVLAAPRTRTVIEKYVVQSGDTLSTIARVFGLSIDTILWANKIRSYQYIRPGDKLIIPPIDGVIYTVKRNETIAKIAKQYRVETNAIVEANNLDGQKIAVGTQLIIPGGRPLPAPAPPKPAPTKVVNRIRDVISGPIPKTLAGIIWPTAARRITQYFRGYRHPGVDIGGPVGTPIYAADDGVVIKSAIGWNGGYGRTVFIDHGDGRETRYGHNSKLLVQNGVQVTKGQTIALMGSTGNSSGPHLHFELWVRGARINPLAYVK